MFPPQNFGGPFPHQTQSISTPHRGESNFSW
jgi:hypothetical protein